MLAGQGLEGRRAEGRAGRNAEGRAGADARRHSRASRSTAMSRPISSRARGWRTSARRSASSPPSRAAAATSSRSTARRRMPARRRAPPAGTPSPPPRASPRRCTRPTTDADDTLRFTIGRVEVSPGSPNTVPGKASFTIDMRHPEDAVLEAHEKTLRDIVAARRAPCTARIERVTAVAPTDFDPHGDRPGARQGQCARALATWTCRRAPATTPCTSPGSAPPA